MTKLVARHVSKAYPTHSEPLVVLQDVSFELDGGQSLAIVGPSGSGKSTLLQLLGTLDRPTSGSILLDGLNPFDLDDRELAEFRNRQIGFVFQDHHLLPQLSALENVLLPLLAVERVAAQDQRRARELLAQVGLANRLTHRPSELSGGERQRAAVARALIREPRLVLADEPTGNLDHKNSMHLIELLGELQQHEAQRQMMLIVVTHNAEVAARMQQCRTLEDGRLRDAHHVGSRRPDWSSATGRHPRQP
jgi:lipoprotein-releasing system ATP-binding protein